MSNCAHDVAIIGGGPAGIAAAIQLHRCGITPVVFEKESIGGLLKNANLIENYPGFPSGIAGLELVNLLRQQVSSMGITVHLEEVKHVDYSGKMFTITTHRREIGAKIVVVASGTQPKRYDHPTITAEVTPRIYYDVFPLVHLKRKRIAIIGAGDVAFDYALNLAEKVNNVTILHRGQEANCLPLLWTRAKRSSKISFYQNTHIQHITCRSKSLILHCRNASKEFDVSTHVLLVAIGREPCLEFLSERLRSSSAALVKNHKLFFIGDVKNDMYRQAAIAIGDGVKAAMSISQHLREHV